MIQKWSFIHIAMISVFLAHCDGAGVSQPPIDDPPPTYSFKSIDPSTLVFGCSNGPAGDSIMPLSPGSNWRFQYTQDGVLLDTLVVAVGQSIVSPDEHTLYPTHFLWMRSSSSKRAKLFRLDGKSLVWFGMITTSNILFMDFMRIPFPGTVGERVDQQSFWADHYGNINLGPILEGHVSEVGAPIGTLAGEFHQTTVITHFRPPSFDVNLGEYMSEYYVAGIGRVYASITTETHTEPREIFSLIDFCLQN